jgi:hypothetical protein
MPYIITKTNGVQLATIDDATLDTSTDLAIPGRNYSGYGLVINENLVKLLENFSGPREPKNPLQGELWYNSSLKKLCVYDGASYKGLASLYIQSTTPSGSVAGDLWWNSEAQQLHGFNGTSFRLIGPPLSNTSTAYWISADVAPVPDEENPYLQSSIGILEAYVGATPAVTISNESFAPDTSNISENFPKVYKGITLSGANPITGVSANTTSTTGTGYILWGTSAHSLLSNVASSSNAINVRSTASNSNFYVPFGSIGTTGTSAMFVSSGFYFNPATNVLYATAARAAYADLAERYEADAIYESGTVLMLGGEKEVTLATLHATTAVAGVVSENPAYLMNADVGTDETHPAIALKGRVPCKICGPVKKGDLLVASGYKPGYATKKQDHDSSDAVIGKALENFEGPFGIIEIKV